MWGPHRIGLQVSFLAAMSWLGLRIISTEEEPHGLGLEFPRDPNNGHPRDRPIGQGEVCLPGDGPEALKVAHVEAVEHLAAKCQDEAERRALVWVMEIIQSDYSPVVLDEAALSRYAGEYGKRRFSVEDGGLFYGHQDFPELWKLVPMSETRFRLDEDMKFEFLMDQDGRASAARIYFCDGRPEVAATRTE